MLKANSAAIALATVVSAILSSNVEAHCYRPTLGGGGFYCGYGCGTCAGGYYGYGCGYGNCYGYGYGYGTLGCNSCGYAPAGYAAIKTGHCWYPGKHLHSCCVRRQALCYGGCGTGGCATGDCSTGGCVEGSTTTPGAGGVINDVPAPGSTINEGPASGDAKSTSLNGSGMSPRRSFMLISNAQQDGSAAFAKGMTALRSRSLTEAVGSFETAAAAEPNNAIYQYHLALALYDLNGAEVASDALQRAVALEQREPIENWGKRMERIQGRSRAWIEAARREAGLVR